MEKREYTIKQLTIKVASIETYRGGMRFKVECEVTEDGLLDLIRYLSSQDGVKGYPRGDDNEC